MMRTVQPHCFASLLKMKADIMAKNGHDYVCDNFAWDIMVEKYKRFFKELEEQHAK